MRKQQYVAAVACLVAGAIGFASVYATENAQKRKEQAKQERMEEEKQPLSAASNELKPQTSKNTNVQSAVESAKEPQMNSAAEQDAVKEPVMKDTIEVEDKTTNSEAETVPTAAADTLHFQPENGIVWPLEGELLLDYSMDATVYFQTLDQYRYNPALVIAAEVNDKVSAISRGKIIEIFNSEETGCTVKQDLGDGYIAIYGQLKELNFDVGDILESGQVIGYVSEPTKYYSLEGTNTYFELQKDGTPVDPMEYLPIQSMDTLE